MTKDKKPFGSEPEDAYEALGRAIRVIRTERGMNRKELAEVSGVSYPYLSEIESGRKTPSSKVMQQVADALRVRPSDLMVEADRLAIGAGAWRRADQAADAALMAAPPLPAGWADEPMSAKQAFAEGKPSSSWGPEKRPASKDRIYLLQRLIRELKGDDVELLIDMAQKLRKSRG